MHLDSDTDRREGQNYAASSSAAYQAMDEDADLFAIHTALSIPEDSNWAEWLPAGVPKSLHDDLLNYFFAYVNPFTLFVASPTVAVPLHC